MFGKDGASRAKASSCDRHLAYLCRIARKQGVPAVVQGKSRSAPSSPHACISCSQVVREVIRAYSYVLLWMAISISVIMFNKWVLAYSGFPFPITLTLWHMVFCSTVGFMCVRVFKVVKSHNMSPREYMNRVLPIGEHASAQGCCSGCRTTQQPTD